MIKAIRSRLGFKLLLSYLVVILIGVAILVGITQVSLPSAFDRHLGGMASMMGLQGVVEPTAETGMMGGEARGQGQGLRLGQNPGMMSDLYGNFRAGFNEALAYAVVAASLVAIAVSLFFSRSVIAPLRAMMSASQRIADGHYDERVDVTGLDELAQLSDRFNQMAGRLEKTEAIRRQLIGDVSHELRTPLTSIKGMMEGLVDGVLPATPETFDQIHREADRLSRLVDDLQELSRVEAGAYQFDLQPVNVKDIVETVMHRFAQQFKAKKVTLKHELFEKGLTVQADEDRLLQVVVNLLANALQYTPEGGEVRISAQYDTGRVKISVSDTGVGIAPEHLPHIFTRFYRVDKSRSRQSGGGSGIGLTIVKHLVEAQGGRVEVTSAGEGQGSQFNVILPAGLTLKNPN